MRSYILFFFVSALAGCQRPSTPGQLEETPVSGWIKLFNGHDLDGWRPKIRGYPLNDNHVNTFVIRDSAITVNYDGYKDFSESFGHLFYKDSFSWYILNVDYRFTGEQIHDGPGWAFRNSGLMLHCQAPETMGLKQDFPISIEVQLLGGNGKDERSTANLCTPGTNVVMGDRLVTDHCVSSASKTYHGDRWVNVKVLVLGDSLVRHIVEGESVLEYTKPQIGGGNVTDFEPAIKEDGKLLAGGYISLQSESHPVQFKTVELLNLEAYRNDPAALVTVLRKLGIQ